jgi:hypothetical protein
MNKLDGKKNLGVNFFKLDALRRNGLLGVASTISPNEQLLQRKKA